MLYTRTWSTHEALLVSWHAATIYLRWLPCHHRLGSPYFLASSALIWALDCRLCWLFSFRALSASAICSCNNRWQAHIEQEDNASSEATRKTSLHPAS